MQIGFIGQGWVGKNYADMFEERGFSIIRYDLEDNIANKELIKECDVTFIAVPTPSTPEGFDHSILEKVLPLIGEEKIAVIKSTILPGTTYDLQAKFPNIYLMHSPEFLTEKTAVYDARNPDRNIIGITSKSMCKATEVMNILPPAPYESINKAMEAELIKYGGNCWFYFKVMFMNTLYDLAKKLEIDFEAVKEGIAADKRVGRTHLDVVHQGGRGAGGHCFIKDFAAYRELYEKNIDTSIDCGIDMLKAIETYNIQLLMNSNKDLDLLEGVYDLGNRE